MKVPFVVFLFSAFAAPGEELAKMDKDKQKQFEQASTKYQKCIQDKSEPLMNCLVSAAPSDECATIKAVSTCAEESGCSMDCSALTDAQKKDFHDMQKGLMEGCDEPIIRCAGAKSISVIFTLLFAALW